MQTVTIIGNGTMALALAQGLKGKYHLEIVGRDEKRLEAFAKKVGGSIETAPIDGFDIENKSVILCVKPKNLNEVAKKVHGKASLLISILAGTTIETLKKSIKATHTLRAMPNVAAKYGKSITTITGNPKGKEMAMVLFNAIGKSVWVESEKELDIATALAGSGPAYLAMVTQGLIEGALKVGLDRETATTLAEGLFEGFAYMVQEEHPALLKESVISPGGTTAAGCAKLEKHRLIHAMIKAIEAAYKRSEELSQV